MSENSISKAKVDSKKEEFDDKYDELQRKTADQEKANKLVSEKHAIVETANTELSQFDTTHYILFRGEIPGFCDIIR